MKSFNKMLEKFTKEDVNLQSDLATIKLNGGQLNLSGERGEQYKKMNKVYRVCDKCGVHIFKSAGRYPNNCSNCGDVIDANDKEVIVTEEQSEKQKEYQEFFKKALEKFKVKSPSELDDDKKKEFFNYVDKNWKGEKEDGSGDGKGKGKKDGSGKDDDNDDIDESIKKKSFKDYFNSKVVAEASFNIDDKFRHKKSNKLFVISSKEGDKVNVYPVDGKPNDKNAMLLNIKDISKYFVKESVDEGKDKKSKNDGPEYKKFFQETLKKFGVKEPDELKGDNIKKFWNFIDKNWKGDNEGDVD